MKIVQESIWNDVSYCVFLYLFHAYPVHVDKCVNNRLWRVRVFLIYITNIVFVCRYIWCIDLWCLKYTDSLQVYLSINIDINNVFSAIQTRILFACCLALRIKLHLEWMIKSDCKYPILEIVFLWKYVSLKNILRKFWNYCLI